MTKTFEFMITLAKINAIRKCLQWLDYSTNREHFPMLDNYNLRINLNILSRASEVGSPTNPPWAPGSDKTRGQGSLSHNYLYKKL